MFPYVGKCCQCESTSDIEVEQYRLSRVDYYRIVCKKCGFRTHLTTNMEDAEELWLIEDGYLYKPTGTADIRRKCPCGETHVGIYSKPQDPQDPLSVILWFECDCGEKTKPSDLYLDALRNWEERNAPPTPNLLWELLKS